LSAKPVLNDGRIDVRMKRLLAIFMLFCTLGGFASDKKLQSAANQRKAAEKEFKQALDYEKTGDIQDALMSASQAALLDPVNPEYAMKRELLKQQIVRRHVDAGNKFAEAGNNEAALAEFREALAIDPQSSFVQQRLRDVMPPENPHKKHILELLASVDQINVRPSPALKSFHLQGDARAIYQQIGQAFGVGIQFDQGLSSRSTRFDLENVDFYTATDVAAKMFKTFWAPLAKDEAIVANDTQENRRIYERMSMRTFYVSNAAGTTDLNDIVNLMRVVFEIRFVTMEQSKNTITVRAPRQQVEAVSALLDNLMDAKPEIMLDVRAIEFDADKARRYGLNLPTSFTIFNIPSEIRRVLGSDAQRVIDQINATGTIDPSTISPSALQNLLNSPLIQPFIVFGGGQTLTGITVSPISGTLAFNKSYSATSEHLTLRAIDGEPALFRNGTKQPIVNSFFTTIAASNAGQAVVGNTPQFTFVDLGVTLKTTPHYLSGGLVKLDLELEISALGTASINSIPDITTRSFKGNITVREGEPSVVAGVLTDQETRSTNGYPGVGQIPGINSVLNLNSSDRPHNELMIVVTPYVVRRPFHNQGTGTIWSTNQ
jgi:general secretion pathway protein D